MSPGNDIRIVAAGDSALLVELPPSIDPATSARVVALGRAIRTRGGYALRDVVVGYCSVTVYFDPLVVDVASLETDVRALASAVEEGASTEAGPLLDVPVCYGGEYGPDLPDVAAFAHASESDVIAIHSSVTYRVYMVGFVPGFPYMASVDARIAVPRRAAPRTHVPAGSVAIAAGQTGIYPSETPGGWHLIGRTPVKPYDARRAEPFMFKPGDRVRFHAIDAVEFERGQ